MNLLILNYSMSLTSLVFSHQPEVVARLRPFFKSTTVVTASSDKTEITSDLKIITTDWTEGQRINSALRFIGKILPILFFAKRPLVVFSHMTEVQSLLVAPVCRLLGIKHFLWYAHASNSIWLRLASPFLTGIVTSTPGSCPLTGKKIHTIGQGVSIPVQSQEFTKINIPPMRWYHVSRIDPSKRIELIGDTLLAFRNRGLPLSLDIYGKTSSSRSNYLETLKTRYEEEIENGWIHFSGQMEFGSHFSSAQKYDGFIHAFVGSLDKALIEATLAERIVVTLNGEYQKEFRLDKFHDVQSLNSLESQIEDWMNKNPSQVQAEIDRRAKIARDCHSLEGWIERLVDILQDRGSPR